MWLNSKAELNDPRTGQRALPRFLGSTGALADDEDHLELLAAWLTSAENPFFARVMANRIWHYLMGVGIVEPIDDFRATNPAANPALLDALAEDLTSHGFDLAHLVRRIMTSVTYQLGSAADLAEGVSERHFTRAVVRRLPAETLLDALCQAAGAAARFRGFPPGMRAGELPGVQAMRGREGGLETGDKFLVLFGKPPRLLACECERSAEPTLAQTFQMISGPLVEDLL